MWLCHLYTLIWQYSTKNHEMIELKNWVKKSPPKKAAGNRVLWTLQSIENRRKIRTYYREHFTVLLVLEHESCSDIVV